jgi:ribonuclease Y
MMASELKLNVAIAKRAGLLHDLGKALDHSIEGTHAQIGADFVKHYEKSPEVLAGIAEHHFETGNAGIWGFLTSAADAISSARPGARRESLENYLKRLRDLEEIADSFKGVEKSYAIQAGREVRILVKPEEIDDLAAMRMAREIVQKIEETMEYPGQIKVTVLRETRAVDYAK